MLIMQNNIYYLFVCYLASVLSSCSRLKMLHCLSELRHILEAKDARCVFSVAR